MQDEIKTHPKADKEPLVPKATHHSDPVSNGLGREVGAELGTDHAAVAMGTGYLPPDHPCPVGFATRGYGVAEETETHKTYSSLIPKEMHYFYL